MEKDVLLQPAQLVRGNDAELAIEAVGEVGEHPERVGLPPAAVEREHQLTRQALAQWELEDGAREHVDDERVVAEREAGVRELLERHRPQLLEPRDLRARRR